MTHDNEIMADLNRRRFVIGSVAGLTTVTIGGTSLVLSTSSVAAKKSNSKKLVFGHDLSMVQQLEDNGSTFSDKGRIQPVERIIAKHGASHVRLRLWVDPPILYNNLQSLLEMAKRVKAAGLKLIITIHYSDFWADPGKQHTPQSWLDQDLPTLTQTVYNYTRDIVARLEKQHTPVDIVQIGNEITAGFLWPLGKLYVDNTQRWSEFTTLLKAGIKGARDGVHGKGHTPQIMLHIDRGGDNGGSRWFYDKMLEWDVDFDLIGLSYYPWWHGTFSDLQNNLNDLATRYHKDIILVETAYPWTMGDGDGFPNIVTDQINLATDYPATPEGQLAYIQHLRSILEQVPEQRGRGIVYWESAWTPGAGWTPGEGNAWDNMTLFDWNGKALPSITCFEKSKKKS